MAPDESSVRVAVRIRPQIAREQIDGCQICTSVTPDQPQVWIGGSQAFTYDDVFDIDTRQETIFEMVRSLVDGCMEGYNATILAYGQTGSGKTYTMGTGFDMENSMEVTESQGIIPRAVHYLFDKIQASRQEALDSGKIPPEFKVNAQFVELYNEEIIDLNNPSAKICTGKNGSFDAINNNSGPACSSILSTPNCSSVKSKCPSFQMRHPSPTRTPPASPPPSGKKATSAIKIHEDSSGGIYMVGVSTKSVTSAGDTLKCLRNGVLSRTTASTNMNDQSSRSHAIFTLHIVQQRLIGGDDVPGEANGNGMSEFETLSAKFHFVDLAGSERLKRTGAVGDRAKEGISINYGLLALGNVISALGDKSKKVNHVPYRDSKLTRLLQDSLGGNSKTIMIACVSPSDRDFVETLNTLKYANRARNIKNKVTINQDKSSRTISLLRQEIQQLQLEILEYKQGKRVVNSEGGDVFTDTHHENVMLKTELQSLQTRIKAKQETIDTLTVTISQLEAKLAIRSVEMGEDDEACDFTAMVQKYMQEIEELRAKLIESEATCEALRKTGGRPSTSFSSPRIPVPMTANSSSPRYGMICESSSVSDLLEEAKKEVQNDQETLEKLKHQKHSSTKNSINNNNHANNNGLTAASDEDMLHSDSSCGDSDSESECEDQDPDSEFSNQQLAELTNEIGVKQRLIEELEKSRQNVEALRAQYEDKLSCLYTKIKSTEDERDKVLSSLQQQKNTPGGKVKQVKEDYEKKLNQMQMEVKKWQGLHKQHVKSARDQSQYERQINQLRTEIDGMKRMKVKLMTQMKEENAKWRNLELKRNKEIAQLRKEQRKKDHAIRTLECDKRTKEQVLKRKHEEVNALKRMAKMNMSKKASGRNGSVIVGKKNFSPVKAKQQWSRIRTRMLRNVNAKASVNNLEREMLSLIEERKAVQDRIHQLAQHKVTAEMQARPASEIAVIVEELDSLTENLNYVKDKIDDLQANIVDIGDNHVKEEDEPDINSLVSAMTNEETAYIVRKMYEQNVANMNDLSQFSQKANELTETNSLLVKEIDNLRQMLQYIYSKSSGLDVPEEIVKQVMSMSNDSEPFERPKTVPMINSASISSRIPNTSRAASAITPSCTTNGETVDLNRTYTKEKEKVDAIESARKARRLTATTQELLGSLEAPAVMTESKSSDNEFRFAKPEPKLPFNRTSSLRLASNKRRGTYNVIPEASMLNNLKPEINVVPAPEPPPPTNHITRNQTFVKKSFKRPAPPQSTNLNSTFCVGRAEMDTSFLEDVSTPNGTPPGSPNSQRKVTAGIREDDVFQRLTSSSRGGEVPEVSVLDGEIRVVSDKSMNSPRNLLVNTHVAEGHTKTVLSVCATEEKLFTGSKDATVKVWDLTTGKETQTLSSHPNNVVCVRYLADQQLVMSVSLCYIKLWDLRMNPNSCVKMLLSSGKATDSIKFDPNHRIHQVPYGESHISDVVISSNANSFYTTKDDRINYWELRTLSHKGLLSGKHMSNVMTLATQGGAEDEVLVSGSKDHCIKVFNFDSGMRNKTLILPSANLDPPHYDGIQALALSGSMLFSGSRDTCIKKWDMDKHEMVYSANNVHAGWITGLSFAPRDNSVLLSSSRDGCVKIWATENMRELGKVEASKGAVECITTNSSIVFTGSSYGSVGFWKLRGSKSNSSSPNGTTMTNGNGESSPDCSSSSYTSDT